MLPFETLLAEHRELGLVLAVLLGFGFGFVLERAGFGRATKLAAQFYLHDMTVFKVMFGAIITAMLGVMVAAGLGLVDLQALSESAVSSTFLWPHLVGGLLLGAGFIISGYCPGTSAVATASGNVDGLLTFAGVIVGSLIYGEVFPLLASFHTSGDQGHMFLYALVGLPPQVLAMLVTLMAIGMFIGAEQVERIFSRRRNGGVEPSPEPRRQRRLVFGALGGLTVLALATLAVPAAIQAEARPSIDTIDQHQLARRVLDEPWKLRILDLRPRTACVKQRIPGAECAPVESLDKLGLPYGSGARDLVLVAAEGLKSVPDAAQRYPGRVLVLDGGFAGWRAFALTPPEPPAGDLSAADRQRHSFRAALNAAMTGRKPPPPPPAQKKYAPKPKKKKGGGCS